MKSQHETKGARIIIPPQSRFCERQSNRIQTDNNKIRVRSFATPSRLPRKQQQQQQQRQKQQQQQQQQEQ